MSSPDCEETPFVPLYAGLNLENFYDSRPRHSDNAIFFEPRSARMDFKRIDDRTAELYQPETPFYGVESWTRFEVKDPYYIDMSFRCIPRKGRFSKAATSASSGPPTSTIPRTENFYFLSARVSSLDKPKWEQFYTQRHGP